MQLTYTVDLDERGTFASHIDDSAGREVFSMLAEGEELDLVEAGYLKHGRDLRGLTSYLREMGVMSAGDTLTLGD